MKKLLSLIISLMLILSLSVFLYAEETETGAESDDVTIYCFDSDELMNEDDWYDTEIFLEEKSEKTACSIAVFLFNAFPDGYDDIVELADDYYDYLYGINTDGVCLALVMETRDWAISTSGICISAMTDNSIDYIFEKIKPDIQAESYKNAFSAFADYVDECLGYYRSGTNFEDEVVTGSSSSVKEEFEWGNKLIISLIVGMIAALVYVSVLKGKMKTVSFKSGAADYTVPDSMNVRDAREFFLYATVSKRVRAQSSSSSSSRSSTHTSSSGGTHGGRSGKF